MRRFGDSALGADPHGGRVDDKRLPTGTVTFVFVDIEDSTQLWEHHPAMMEQAIRRFQDLTAGVVGEAGGAVVNDTGDGLLASFAATRSAVRAASEIQRALLLQPPQGGLRLRARIGVHVGDVEPTGGNYYGPTLNRCARVMDAGHGGQILVTDEVVRRLRSDPDNGPDTVSTFRDLGLHRLRSLEQPMRLFQVCDPGLADAFGPLRTLDHVPHNLPVAPTTLIGRSAELGEICAALATARLVTVTGTGGSGKTRLGLQVAADISGRFSDGVWLVELASVADAAFVAPAAAAAMGVAERPDVGWTEALALKLGDKEVLVLVDNCEHVVAGVASLLHALLARCPQLHILATSREALGVQGEVTIPLAPLGLPVDDSLASALGSDAVRLFVERAMAADGRFLLGEETLPAILRRSADASTDSLWPLSSPRSSFAVFRLPRSPRSSTNDSAS